MGISGTRQFVNDKSWMDAITQIGRPNSVCNRSVIERFVGVFVLPHCPFVLSVVIGAFSIGLSRILSLFLSIDFASEQV